MRFLCFNAYAKWVNQFLYYKWQKIKNNGQIYPCVCTVKFARENRAPIWPWPNEARLEYSSSLAFFFTCVWSSKSKADTRYAYQSDCKLFISALKKFQWNMCIRQWKHVVSDDFSASPSLEHWKTKWRVTSLICT